MIVKVDVEVTNDMLENIIVNALETGACSSWLSWESNAIIKDFKWDNVNYAAQILNGDAELIIYDIETDEYLGRLNKVTIEQGIKKLSDTPEGTAVLSELISGNDDADTADYIMQTIILGNIVYG